MGDSKSKNVAKLFEGHEIRSVWDSERGDYWFSVVDVVSALAKTADPRNYWKVLKKRLADEGSQLVTKCNQLRMKSTKDGKNYKTDVLDTKGIFRLIESIPSPKAEPFKAWLARMGSEIAVS